jgi:hypothetical protein
MSCRFNRQAEAGIPVQCQSKTVCRTGSSRQADPRHRKSIPDCMRSDHFAGAVKLGDMHDSVAAKGSHPIDCLVPIMLKNPLGADLQRIRLLQQPCANRSGSDGAHGVTFGVVPLMGR